MEALTVAQILEEVKRTGGKLPWINTTQTFFLLVQAVADAVDARGTGEDAGIIKGWMGEDEAVAMVLAYYLWIGYETRNAEVVGAMLTKYCRLDIAASFYDFYPQIAKQPFNEVFPKGVGESLVEMEMNIEQYARSNSANFKLHWNPFREPFSSAWNNGFAPA